MTAQGDWKPGTIVGINPTSCLVDGAVKAINVLTGHPYIPLVGDRVALTQFGSNQLALPVDMVPMFQPVDDLWHAVGDVGEPQFQNGIVDHPTSNDQGTAYGETLRFYRDRAGVVWLEGLINLPSVGSTFAGMVIFQLPAGYRPNYQLCFATPSNNGIYQVGVDPDGTVYIQGGPGTAASYLSLDAVSFVSEDGPNVPAWTDCGSVIDATNGWGVVGGFTSTYASASGSPYPGVRYCIDAAGDVHFSGMVGTTGGGQNVAAIVTTLLTAPATASLQGNIDTDVNNVPFLVACSGTPGFARVDLQPALSSGSIGPLSYGANTATSLWVSLDGLAWAGGNNPSRWATGVAINSWAAFAGLTFVEARMNKFGTVYLRGVIHGTAATAADAQPSTTWNVLSPNIAKVLPAVCGSTSGCGAARSDINSSGVVPGVQLFTAQSAGSATTSYVALTNMKWATRRYGA